MVWVKLRELRALPARRLWRESSRSMILSIGRIAESANRGYDDECQ